MQDSHITTASTSAHTGQANLAAACWIPLFVAGNLPVLFAEDARTDPAGTFRGSAELAAVLHASPHISCAQQQLDTCRQTAPTALAHCCTDQMSVLEK